MKCDYLKNIYQTTTNWECFEYYIIFCLNRVQPQYHQKLIGNLIIDNGFPVATWQSMQLNDLAIISLFLLVADKK